MKWVFIIVGLMLPFISFSQGGSKYYLNRAQKEDFNRDYKNAILDYTRVIALNPNDPWWYMARGQVKFKIKDTTGAIADLNKSIEVDSNFSYGYFQRGVLKNSIGDKKGSDWDFHKSEDIKHPFFIKARSELKKEDYQNALNDFLVALSLHPNDYDIYFELSVTEEALGNTWNSGVYLRKGIKIYKLSP